MALQAGPLGPDHDGDRPEIVGRTAEVDRFCGVIAPGHGGVVIVGGQGGIGKSALVRAALHAGQSFDRVVTLNARGLRTGKDCSRLMLKACRRFTAVGSVGPAEGGRRPRIGFVLEDANELPPQVGDIPLPAEVAAESMIILVTRRQLRIRGATHIRLAKLTPDAARQLFLTRAAEHEAAFTRAELDPVVDDLCSAVGCYPLAVELAATRLRMLPPEDLLEHLRDPDRALDLLDGAASQDQHGIRSAIRQAYDDDLSPYAQDLFEVCGCFTSPVQLAALESLMSDRRRGLYAAVDSLVDAGLLAMRQENHHAAEYDQSPLVRAFARELLMAREDHDRIFDRHAAHFSTLARSAAEAVANAQDDAPVVRRMAAVRDDGIAALRWLRKEPLAQLRLAADLLAVEHIRCLGAVSTPERVAEAAQTAVQLLAATAQGGHAAIRDPESRSIRRDALLGLANFATLHPYSADLTVAGQVGLDEGVSLARDLGEPLALLRALTVRTRMSALMHDPGSAEVAAREGLHLAIDLGNPRWHGRFEVALGMVLHLQGDAQSAARCGEAALRRSLRSGDELTVVGAALLLGPIPADVPVDRSLLPSPESLLMIARRCGDEAKESHLLLQLAGAALLRQDLDLAARRVAERLRLRATLDQFHGLPLVTVLTVWLAFLRGDHAIAARLHGALEAQVPELIATVHPTLRSRYHRMIDVAREQVGADQFVELVATGVAMSNAGLRDALNAYVDEVLGGSPASAPESPGSLSDTAEPRALVGPTALLTARERAVLALLAAGHSNKEIAETLCITTKSVMHHTGAIYRKLGVQGRAAAAVIGARDGLAFERRPGMSQA